MILKALHTSGWLDIGAQETLENEKISFRRSLAPNQTIELPDEYRGLRNIDTAITKGLLQVVSYDSRPGSLVVNDELVPSTSQDIPLDNYYTKIDSDARFQQMRADGASIVFKEGKIPYVYCPNDGLYYPILITMINGVPTLSLGSGEQL